MEGYICTDGTLNIKRGITFTNQYCRMNKRGYGCNDHCPLFGEPFKTIHPRSNPNEPREVWALELCHKTLYFDKFRDTRGK